MDNVVESYPKIKVLIEKLAEDDRYKDSTRINVLKLYNEHPQNCLADNAKVDLLIRYIIDDLESYLDSCGYSCIHIGKVLSRYISLAHFSCDNKIEPKTNDVYIDLKIDLRAKLYKKEPPILFEGDPYKTIRIYHNILKVSFWK